MLIKLWRWLFGACEHKWVTIGGYGGYTGWLSPKYDYVLRCDKCGNMKQKRLYMS